MVKEKLVLEINDLVVNYETDNGTVHAVNGINLKLKQKQSVGIVGETGAGKTTTALAILNLIPQPTGIIKNGTIIVDGKNMLTISESDLRMMRGKGVSMIFQDPMTALNPVFTIGEQIAESVRIHEGVSNKDAMQRAIEMLEIVGIDKDRAYDYPHQLSGGMKQRVVIAIALACQAKLLIADEPTTALDVTIQAQVLELIRSYREKYDTAMILITHDLGIVAETCDEVAVMYAGVIVEYGTLEDIFNRTKHPYTEGLFNSLPNIIERRSKLTPIPGMVLDPTILPDGCVFADRCSYVIDTCRTTFQKDIAVSDTHIVRCSRYQEPGFNIKRMIA
ncbi:MAG: ABC transporter ATP-binding protein [Chloroflexi bacterium]|nr:ABC transporter ATP-binding protein [Chloroflexota bacterium]